MILQSHWIASRLQPQKAGRRPKLNMMRSPLPSTATISRQPVHFLVDHHSGADAQEILELMEQEPDSEKRGIVEILHEIEPGLTRFFLRIQFAGTLNMVLRRGFFGKLLAS
jgi:hypothetical protein